MSKRFQDPPPSRPTVNDVAEAAGVSTATVSRVLNGSPDVSGALRVKVEAVIESLGYIRDSTARALAMKRSFLLGAIRSGSADPSFAATLSAFEAAAQTAGFGVLTTIAGPNGDIRHALRHLLEHGVEGIFLCDGEPGESAEPLLAERNLPLLVTGQDTGAGALALETSRLSADPAPAARQAVEMLAALGHRRFAILCEPPGVSARLAGWRAAIVSALNRAGFEPALELAHGSDLAAGRRGLAALAELPRPEPPPTALLCSNDLLAEGALVEAAVRDIAIPRALSVIGSGDLAASRHLQPALSTLHFDAEDIGTRAAECLAAQVEKRPAPMRLSLPVGLMLRESVGPAPAITGADLP